jgi:hypothetical protein
MKETIRAAQEFLRRTQHGDGGWPYRTEAQSYPEPTCYSLLALSWISHTSESQNPKSEKPRRGVHWLEAHVNARGALTLDGDDEPHWSTSLLVITLTRLQPAESVGEKCAQWLLSWHGNAAPPQKEIAVNSQLRGWPWISDTFSWVEPTSYAILALKMSGHGDHPRVVEAERLLLDRACADGGWNYGVRGAMGYALTPFLPTTALAILALQDLPAAQPIVDQSLAVLRREVSHNQSTLALALAILCFNALGRPTDEFIPALLNRQKADGSWRQAIDLTALAALALDSVTGGPNVFKV